MKPQEAALATFLADRTQTNRDALIEAHIYLCRRAGHKFWRRGLDRRDLEQIAALGLIKAADHYDARLQTPFEAYAWLTIVGDLMHHVRDHERIVRAPRRLQCYERRHAATYDALRSRLEREPTTSEIAAAMALSPAIVAELGALQRGAVPLSLESGSGAMLRDRAAESRALPLEDRLALSIALDALGTRERAIVLGTFASGFSQAELGARLGLSQSQVSKIMKRALHRMQRGVA
jgi:RNA polymerase sigma-B factor